MKSAILIDMKQKYLKFNKAHEQVALFQRIEYHYITGFFFLLSEEHL